MRNNKVLTLIFLFACTLKAFAASGNAGYFNVQTTYGATGNGITDDSTAIQAALNDAGTAGGGVVFLPRPSSAYLVKTPLVLKPNVTLLGEPNTDGSIGGSMIRAGAASLVSILNTPQSPDGKTTYGGGVSVENISLDGNSCASGCANGTVTWAMNFYDLIGARLANIRVINVSGGALTIQPSSLSMPTWTNFFENLDLQSSSSSSYAVDSSASDSYWVGIKVTGGKGFHQQRSGGNLFTNLFIQNSIANGFTVDTQNVGMALSITDSTFQNNGAYGFYASFPSSFSARETLSGNVFSNNASGDIGLLNTVNMSFAYNYFESPTAPSLAGSSDYLAFYGNDFAIPVQSLNTPGANSQRAGEQLQLFQLAQWTGGPARHRGAKHESVRRLRAQPVCEGLQREVGPLQRQRQRRGRRHHSHPVRHQRRRRGGRYRVPARQHVPH